MKTKRVALILGLLVLLLTTRTVLAAPPFDTVVEEGERSGEIVALDGDVEIKEGGIVDGNVTVFNGDAYIAGIVKGDVVLFNGSLEATSTADITGNCVLLNGDLKNEADTSLSCADVNGLPNLIPAWKDFTNTDFPPDPPPATATQKFFLNLAEATGRSLILGFLAFVIASLLPRHLSRVEETVRRKPVASGSVGLLTAVAVPSLVALLLPVSIILTFVCIGLLGFPIMLALLLGLVAGALLGWVTVGNMLGERLVVPLKLEDRGMPVTAALGTVVLTFVIGLMGFGEGVVSFLVVCVGLGATALTKFGTQAYPAMNREISEKVPETLETLLAIEETVVQKESGE